MNNYIKNLSKNLKFINKEETDNQIIISVSSLENECRCPKCGTPSKSVQAKYIKKFQDLPINGKTVYIKINNRVFNCVNNDCDNDMFAEEYDFVEFKQNKTNRLINHIIDISSTNTCRAAEKILRDEGIVVGKSTISLLSNKYRSE